MKVQICINTNEIKFDYEASIELELPYVPRKKDIIYLSYEYTELLRQKIIKKITDTNNYFPYRECLGFTTEYAGEDEEEKVDLDRLDIEDWIYVENIAIDTKDNSILVCLTNAWDTYNHRFKDID